MAAALLGTLLAGCTTSEATAPLQAPAAPTNAIQMMIAVVAGDSEFDPNGPEIVAAEYSWTPPAGPIDGYYFYLAQVFTDRTPRTTCDSSWEKLPASATTHRIPSMQSDTPSYICAFNAAGTSPTVQFTIAYGPGVWVS
jgi:hypothetical protein